MKLPPFLSRILTAGLSEEHASKLKLRGEFKMKVLDVNGNVLEEYEELNVIVTVGRGQLARLLGGDVTNRSITKIGFGTNGTVADVGDTALSGPPFIKNVGAVTYPDPTSVMFAWTLGTSEGNGLVIQEFGLLTAGLTLFSRKQRDSITKNSSISLSGTWKIIL